MKHKSRLFNLAWKTVQYLWSFRQSEGRIIYIDKARLEVTSEGGLALEGVVAWDTEGLWRPGDGVAVNRVVTITGGFAPPYPLLVRALHDGNRRYYRTGSMDVVVLTKSDRESDRNRTQAMPGFRP